MLVTNFPTYYIGVRDGKKEKEGRINLSFVFCHTIYLALSMCIQNLKTLALTEAKKYVTENLLGEKEKWTNKGNNNSSTLILFYPIQQVIPNICTKFQNPRHSSS